MEKERTSPWLILFRVVFTAALIACIMFIFRNSLENGAQSSARSQAVMQLVNSALAKVHLGPLSEHLIRKLAHFSEFALEGFLLMLCIRVYTKHFVRHMSWPLLGGMTTALMDETIQLHSLNRTSSVVDVWIDMSGVVAGLLFALIILLIVRGVTAFIRVKQENRALRAESAELRRREHERLARRAGLGLGRTGGLAFDGSGDIFIAFSTANRLGSNAGGGPREHTVRTLSHGCMDPLFRATVEATHEAIVNALCAATDTDGILGRRMYALPLDEVRGIMRRYESL